WSGREPQPVAQPAPDRRCGAGSIDKGCRQFRVVWRPAYPVDSAVGFSGDLGRAVDQPEPAAAHPARDSAPGAVGSTPRSAAGPGAKPKATANCPRGAADSASGAPAPDTGAGSRGAGAGADPGTLAERQDGGCPRRRAGQSLRQVREPP